MKTGAGLSTAEDARVAAAEATRDALHTLGGDPASLALVFASPHHAAWVREIADAVRDAAAPGALLGCVGESVVGGAREVEDGPAVAVWLGSFAGAPETFHMTFVRTESGGVFAGWTFDRGGGPPATHLLLADPFSFPADALLGHLNDLDPRPVVVGGLASGARQPGEAILIRDGEILHEGAVGVRLPEGVALRTLVSQGCRPFGSSYVVTKARDNFLLELGGRPPLERLEEALSSLAKPDRELAADGLQVGRVIDEYKTEHGQGDFLIRGVIGVDPDSGALAVGDRVEVGETIRFHVRDAATADEELRALLQESMADLHGRPAGALLFTCNGRGTRLFPEPDHDARLVSDALDGAALAGFFCAGEFGPVGGRNFLHGLTASLAIFVDRRTA
jgi:small ligand-binding sensory domain FIST